MAAGIVYHDITTATGVTFSLACWVPETTAPDVGAIPVSLPIKSDGTPADPTTFALESGGNLAAILAKIIAAPATEAKQDAGNTSLATLAAKVESTAPTTGLSINPAQIGALGAALPSASISVTATSTRKNVAASQTDAPLGAAGAIGDLINGILVVPESTSPGAITIIDGADSPPDSITVFAGGANSLLTLHPFWIEWGNLSENGGWSITTGANLSVVVFGEFTEV